MACAKTFARLSSLAGGGKICRSMRRPRVQIGQISYAGILVLPCCVSLPRLCSVCATGPRKSSENRVHAVHEFSHYVRGLVGAGRVACCYGSGLAASHVIGTPHSFIFGGFHVRSVQGCAAASGMKRRWSRTISAQTIGFHYHKHHQTYVDTLNKLAPKTKFADMKLEQIVQALGDSKDEKEKQNLQQCRPDSSGTMISTGAA